MKTTQVLIAGTNKVLYKIDDKSFLDDKVFTHYKENWENHVLTLTFFHKLQDTLTEESKNKVDEAMKNIDNKLKEIINTAPEANKDKVLKLTISKVNDNEYSVEYDLEKFKDVSEKLENHIPYIFDEFLLEEGIIKENSEYINKENMGLIYNSQKYIDFKNLESNEFQKEQDEELQKMIDNLKNIPIQSVGYSIESEEWFYEESLIDSGLNPVIMFFVEGVNEDPSDSYEGMPLWVIDKINKAIDNTNNKFSKKLLEHISFGETTENRNAAWHFHIEDTPYEENLQKTALDIKMLLPIFIKELEKLDFYSQKENIYSYENGFEESCEVLYGKCDEDEEYIDDLKEEFPEWNYDISLEYMKYSNLSNPKQEIIDLVYPEILREFKKLKIS